VLGPSKVLWGSDYPVLSQRFDLRAVAQLTLGAEARERLLGGNCRDLLGSAGDRPPSLQ